MKRDEKTGNALERLQAAYECLEAPPKSMQPVLVTTSCGGGAVLRGRSAEEAAAVIDQEAKDLVSG
eukprot:1161325-Pelagomonas_calceolata.AAC.19